MMMTVAAYISYMEMCAMKRTTSSTALFKGFQHRSAGPLFSLLRQALGLLDGRGIFSAELNRLNQEPLVAEMKEAVASIAQAKHGKRSSIDYPRLLVSLGNCLVGVFSENLMGYFQDVKRRRFADGFGGLFRAAKGANKPFIDLYAYSGNSSFSSECVYVVNPASEVALNLSPLVFWDLDCKEESAGEADMFFYDTSREGQQSVGFKAVMLREEFRVGKSDHLRDVFEEVQRMREGDPEGEVLGGVRLTPTWEREA